MEDLYVSPQVECLEVEVETGFETSSFGADGVSAPSFEDLDWE